MRNFKSLIKRMMSVMLAAVMLISIAPIGELADVDWSEFVLIAGATENGNVEFDETKPYIEAVSTRGKAGSTVTAKVRIANNPGMASFKFGFEYDERVLVLENVEIDPAIGGSFEYRTHAVWYSNKDTTYNGDVLTLTFRVLDSGVFGETYFSVLYNSQDIVNYSEEPVEFELKSGVIEIYEYLRGDINNDNVVNNKDLTRLHKYLAGVDVEVVEKTLDVNGDGSHSVSDLVRLMRYLSGEVFDDWLDYPIPGEITKVEDINMKSSAEGCVGDTIELTAEIIPSDATNKNIIWTSDDESIATVDENGKVTLVGVGETIITATAADGSGVSASCRVVVDSADVKVSIITLSQDSYIYGPGTLLELKATVYPENATNKDIEWKSSNPAVAMVQDGLVALLNPGKAIITAKAKDGSDAVAACEVTVDTTEVKSIKVESFVEGLIGDVAELNAEINPSYAANHNIVWTSSEERVVTVDSQGKLTFVGVGEAEVRAASTDGYGAFAICKVKVNPVLAESITLSKTSYEGDVGDGFSLSATVFPINTTYNSIVWSSSDNSIATVDSSGWVRFVGAGDAVITATATDGSDVSAECTVKVNFVPAESVCLDSYEAHLTAGNLQKLTATVYPNNATNKNVTWSSSNVSVATVDTNGNVKAVAEGTAVITVTTNDGNKTASCTVTVTPKVSEIVVYPSSYSWYVGKTAKMTAIVKPSGARQDVTWSVSDTSYATIDADGNIAIIKAPGLLDFGSKKITITATAKDGSGVKGTYELEIKKKVDVTGIEFAKDENGNPLNDTTFWVNGVFEPVINYSPSDASEKTCTFTSSNSNVAKVQEDGTILMVGAGSATITATSVDGGKKATWNITVTEANMRFNATDKKLAVDQETVTVIISIDPKAIVSKYGLRFHVEDESVLKLMKYEHYSSSYYRATFAVMGSGTTEVTASVGDIAETKTPLKVEVIDLKVDDYYDDLKVGDSVTVEPKVMLGNTEIKTSECISYLCSVDYVQYFKRDWNVNEDGSVTFEVIKELPSDAIYIDLEYEHAGSDVTIEKRLYFVGEKTVTPKVDFEYAKHLATVASNASGNRMQKVVNCSDTNVTSSEIDIEASDSATNILITAMKDRIIAESGLNPDDFVHELFTESTFETKNNADGLKTIGCNESDVESVTVNDEGGRTYEVVLTLKDQKKLGVNEIADSAYGKTMPVIDKAYADYYVNALKNEMGSSERNNVSYGTFSQTYRDGKVVFTINKLTEEIEKVEYYFVADLDFKDAQLVMSEPMDDMGTVDVIVNATFTTTVEEKFVYKNLTY